VQRYQANTPRIVDDLVDGEVLLIDMVTGAYFSALDASALAWLLLKAGATSEDVATELVARYGIDAADAQRDTDAYVDALTASELLAPRANEVPPAGDLLNGVQLPPHSYAALDVEKFTEIADLILLDPVHDVAETGWPHTPRD
jgi:hypothetical protein